VNAIDSRFAGSIPETYDAFLVPLIFESYASDLAGRAAALAPRLVLETAAGSGVVMRALAPQLADDARYVVTDLNQPMLNRAAARFGPDERVIWRQADALELPFEAGTFDVVLCQFGVMFFPDRVAGYREARRVLKDGGSFLFNSWDRIEENEFADLVTRTAAEVFPDNPPKFLARTPHGYCDVDLIRKDVEAAGFTDVSIDTVDAVSAAPSPRHPAIAYCHGTPLRNEIEERDATLLGVVTDRAEAAIAERYGAESVSAKIRGHVVIAKR